VLQAAHCARVLAKTHCNTNQGAVICGYIYKGDRLAEALTEYAELYADQTEKYFEEFKKATCNGELPILTELDNPVEE